ncbi:glycoside hydrolase family 95 protein [Rheinheimera sediminis]|uniref:glycoside hydrolase family 95 protein n=1 Tax=Rheinheimera sp. YQF-1 TaxID=2499626 RepID=UPI000FD8A368|nr:glycoside hydrolase family 95 protein [Rheinheimera sp. YQF-1]RVT48626.1 glycoside hydrolase family 95 protein [Rheinheimera sp. YQF-1]
MSPMNHCALTALVQPLKLKPDVWILALLLLCTLLPLCTQAQDLSIVFRTPAQDWESESLPIGNGALGANVMGAIETDELQFAEKTLWTGGPGSKEGKAGKEGYDFGLPADNGAYPKQLAAVQQQLTTAGQLTPELVAKSLGRDYSGYGSYQNFATVQMRFAHKAEDIKEYQRTLDLKRAVATVSYIEQGVRYQRDYFVSYPDQVIVTRLHADQKAKIYVELSLTTAENRSKVLSLQDNRISLSGALKDNGLQYATALQVRHSNGSLRQTAHSLVITAADEVWFVVAASTNYRQHYPDYRGEAALPQVDKRLSALSTSSYPQLLEQHLQDYQKLFARVSFDVQGQAGNLDTPALLKGYGSSNSKAQDRALEALYFHYGRYLLISSSRPGSLPANLQGVWNKYDVAPWMSDYHVNINLQMNYWLAESTNLTETLPPLFDFVDSLVAPGQRSAKTLFNADGWTLLLNTNIWGFTGLIAWPTAFWQPEAAAWMARHYYEHYLFNQDLQFLKQRAYPLMLGATEFWLDALQKNQQGNYLVSPSYSPEHGQFTAGAAMSQQIVFDLLHSTSKVAELLGDQANQQRIQQVLAKLDPGLRVGSWGQLQEWQQDIDDKSSKHRHASHLYALHPGDQISVFQTPELAEAARVSLNARGEGHTGWSKAWKINFWARLLDGNQAHQMLAELLKHSTLSNLWDTHPPFQIDGNLGATAGIAEMLLQSHQQTIHLLPALPASWPQGQITGLRARGAVTLDLQWQNSELKTAQLQSKNNQSLRLRIQNSALHYQVTDTEGKSVPLIKQDGTLRFDAVAGQLYRLSRI